MDYPSLLPFHNLMRWLIVLAGIWAVARSVEGWWRGRPWTRQDTLAGLCFSTCLHLQLVIGVLLYLNSPYVRPIFTALGYATSSLFAFFFTLGHPLAMVSAVLLAQVTYSLCKRSRDDRSRFRRAALGYSLTALLILAAIPWPALSYGRPLVREFFFGRIELPSVLGSKARPSDWDW